MKIKYSYIILLLILQGCTGSQQKADRAGKSPLHQSLIGQWEGFGNGKPVLDITEDSIYYFSHRKSYPYTMEKNDLVMIDNGIRVRLSNIEVMSDTLVYENPPGFSIAALRCKTYHPH